MENDEHSLELVFAKDNSSTTGYKQVKPNEEY